MKRASRKGKEPGLKIGVVEEVADNIYSIKFILQSLGYEVGSFSAGSPSYIDELAEFAPALVIVDMMIPHGGGYSVIRGIQKSRLSKVPVLAITADAMEGESKDVLKVGARDILAKPYAVSDLQEKLARWLEPEEEPN